MKLAFFIVIFGLFVSSCLAQSQKIFGTYLKCEFACTAIKLNPDFTFEYLLDGDLFNNQRTKGKWKLIGKNKIKAESPKPGSPLVKEKNTNRNNFLIIVTDFTGAVIPSAEISGVANDQNFKCNTDENGLCEIPKCKEFNVAFLQYRGTHKIINLEAREFTVELSYEQMGTTIVDDVWLIEGNRLYTETNGAVNRDYYLEKVSSKKERKLFPK